MSIINPDDYVYVRDAATLERLIHSIREHESVALDTEPTACTTTSRRSA